ncbi:hypothetical protein WJX72_005482 [[Myrmecia] bisecta]|uniref:lipoyl(octanoyl) transferase n=1 Tax=[Myrmecia] bisecta TaxID=41462 RepID=A0AAW1R6U3_9CHLO
MALRRAGEERTFNAGQQLIPYETAWAWQKLLVAEAQRAARAGSRDIADAILLLQHPSVYTLGAGSTEDNLRFDPSHPPFPLYRTERGGEVTYHGPGQLVLYPIMNLRRHQPDLHWYLRQLEEVVIRALDSVSGLHGERIDGLTGVWVEGKKEYEYALLEAFSELFDVQLVHADLRQLTLPKAFKGP